MNLLRSYDLMLGSVTVTLCCVWRMTRLFMTGVTSGAGTAYHSGAPEFTPGF